MSAVKALQQWCRVQVQGYRDVSITNMTTSFRDGLAFCALIHKHRPDLINFDSLKKENVYENNKLAFGVAEEELGIPALLDAEDMVALQIPDRLSILTYVSQYYNYFHGRSPIGGMGGIKRPAEGPAEEPSGKKNQPMVSKVFPSSRPTRENSPPPSSNTSRPPPSPKYPRNAKQDVVVEKSNQTGTLSNKCISCNKRVHLVERHLVDGKLYHRSCAKSLAPITNCPPLRDLPTNTSVSKPTPPRDPSKTSIDISSRLGPTWQKDKASTPPSFSSTLSTPSPPPSRPVSALSSAAKDSRTSLASKPVTSQAPSGPTFTTTASAAAAATRPAPAPRTSTTVVKTLQSKIQFFQSDDSVNNEKKATNTDTKKAGSGTGAVQHVTAGEAVTITVNIGKKDVSLNSAEDKSKASGVGSGSGNGSESSKAKAAAFISRKLAEENNNNKPPRTNVALKKTDKPSQVETPKREKEAVRGRVKLKVDPSLLADLQTPEESRPVPVPRRPRSRTPDPGPTNPSSILPNTSAEHESPADWRSKLKPISKQTKALGPSPSSPKLSANEPGKSQTSGPAQPQGPSPSISITPPAPKGSLNGQQDLTRPDAEAKVSKKKPDYIPKEDILKELQEIDDNLTKLEKEGVQLEMRLRRCEEDGEDDSFMDELMVEWFNLIRNKQVAMRRESELVYIGKTQELEEQQPSVEQELRRLMETPEHLKSSWHDKREKELMTKLMEIVNDRNAIVEGLDEDRLREEEEDEQLNRMMKDFNIKKEKPKKKSPMSKLFSWGSKKETP